jgi:hypothetical protein
MRASLHQEAALAESSLVANPDVLVRALCAIVFAIIAVAVAYAAWIALSNFSRIGV